VQVETERALKKPVTSLFLVDLGKTDQQANQRITDVDEATLVVRSDVNSDRLKSLRRLSDIGKPGFDGVNPLGNHPVNYDRSRLNFSDQARTFPEDHRCIFHIPTCEGIVVSWSLGCDCRLQFSFSSGPPSDVCVAHHSDRKFVRPWKSARDVRDGGSHRFVTAALEQGGMMVCIN
jgi:hypothetical protein